ncbi:MAG: CDP-diacylglycerol--serine O-phosphatidyltransferase [Bacteroidales bacterium]|jgi:CDP-diacylglycerol--serine O-phosphatidyltransferase|nr:CDP-diacylglycerol--serine O-phosphatidyltransferase [Bacteroidales bacterium]
MKRYIPNFITSLNLASGFIAMLFAVNGELITASWLILVAMFFDFLDGFSARLLNAYSETGKELDSLADVVSFGVAPAVIIYMLLGKSMALPDPMIYNARSFKTVLILLSPVIMPVCAALRLAIFNIDETQKASFKGLPTPANALAVISFVIAGHYSNFSIITSFTDSMLLLIIFTVILSLLMVSRIPLLSFKTNNLRFKGNEGRYILVSMVVIAIVLLGTGAAPLIIPLYITASLISLLFRPKGMVSNRA